MKDIIVSSPRISETSANKKSTLKSGMNKVDASVKHVNYDLGGNPPPRPPYPSARDVLAVPPPRPDPPGTIIVSSQNNVDVTLPSSLPLPPTPSPPPGSLVNENILLSSRRVGILNWISKFIACSFQFYY